MIELIRKLDRDLLRDFKTGAYNIHKIGNAVVVFTWTLYMLTVHPDDVVMWTAYAGVLMGASALQYGQKRGADRKEGEGAPPPAGPTTTVQADSVTVKQ